MKQENRENERQGKEREIEEKKRELQIEEGDKRNKNTRETEEKNVAKGKGRENPENVECESGIKSHLRGGRNRAVLSGGGRGGIQGE